MDTLLDPRIQAWLYCGGKAQRPCHYCSNQWQVLAGRRAGRNLQMHGGKWLPSGWTIPLTSAVQLQESSGARWGTGRVQLPALSPAWFNTGICPCSLNYLGSFTVVKICCYKSFVAHLWGWTWSALTMLSRENSSPNHLKHACNITQLQARLTDTSTAKETDEN